MRIGGFQKFSLLDYPGKIAAIVFTQGCNFRCGYCHNPQLVCPRQFQATVEESVVLGFLGSRRGKLQGVVVSGGEPTVQKGLLDFLDKLKAMGYAVKLDTNGSDPQKLASIIELHLADFIAMDIKTSLARYEKAVGVKPDIERIKASIDLIIKSGLPYQFRTTLVKAHCSGEDLKDIQELIGPSRCHALQSFIPSSRIIDRQILSQEQYTPKDVQDLRLQFQR